MPPSSERTREQLGAIYTSDRLELPLYRRAEDAGDTSAGVLLYERGDLDGAETASLRAGEPGPEADKAVDG